MNAFGPICKLAILQKQDLIAMVPLFVVIFCAPPVEAEALLIKRIVVENTQGQGLEATVEIEKPDRKLKFIGETSKTGILDVDPPELCHARHKLKFTVPLGPYIEKKVACSKLRNPVKEVLASWGFMTSLYGAYQNNLAAKNKPAAALAASEIGARLKSLSVADLTAAKNKASKANAVGMKDILASEIRGRNTTKSDFGNLRWSTKSFKIIGDHFGLKQPLQFVPDRKKYVMTYELSQQLRSYQRLEGLNVTGELDYSTLSKMSGANVGDLLNAPKTR